MSDIIVTNVTENKHWDCDSVTAAWLTSSPQLSLIKNWARVCFVTQPEPLWGSEILFYMQTGTINCINWTFNFSQQYLGKVLVQYIHPSDILRVCYILYLLWWHSTVYQVSAELWKVSVHNEKAGPGFIYGTYDPVVITPLALTSRSHWAWSRITQLYWEQQYSDREHHCSSLSIVIRW